MENALIATSPCTASSSSLSFSCTLWVADKKKHWQHFHIANLYEPTAFLTTHSLETMAITGGKTFFNYLGGYGNSFIKTWQEHCMYCFKTLHYSTSSLSNPSSPGNNFSFFSPKSHAVCTHGLQKPSSANKKKEHVIFPFSTGSSGLQRAFGSNALNSFSFHWLTNLTLTN